jgi:DNA-binding CsgD family transcriptional regulator
MDSVHMKAKDYKNILQFLSQIQDIKTDYRYKVLKNLSTVFDFNFITFLLMNEDGMFTDTIGLNISNQLCQIYAEHYFKTDIFHPVNLSTQFMLTKKVVSISDIMPLGEFENTEYYNDFLKKENLYYEIAIPLIANNRLIGGIGIFKSKGEGDFTQRDIKLMDNLSSHISYHFNDYLEASQIKNEQLIYKNCLYQSPVGLVVLDSNRSLVNCNDIANTFCLDILNKLSNTCSTNPVQDVINLAFSNLDFNGINSSSCLYTDFQQYKFKIVLSIIPHFYKGVETYYHIYIIKNSDKEKIDLASIAQVYNLTERELEIIEHISQGLSNREIAHKLYISSHTVRTHIDNIFNKLNVSSRMAILHKLQIIKNI